jgi:hypothetical protein
MDVDSFQKKQKTYAMLKKVEDYNWHDAIKPFIKRLFSKIRITHSDKFTKRDFVKDARRELLTMEYQAIMLRENLLWTPNGRDSLRNDYNLDEEEVEKLRSLSKQEQMRVIMKKVGEITWENEEGTKTWRPEVKRLRKIIEMKLEKLFSEKETVLRKDFLPIIKNELKIFKKEIQILKDLIRWYKVRSPLSKLKKWTIDQLESGMIKNE